MTDQREIEAKFEADPGALAALLTLQQFAGFEVTRHPPKDQDDLYFDTVAGNLKDNGASLRVRQKGNQAQLTFKGERIASPDDPHVVSRLEDEVLLPGFDAASLSWDEPLLIEPGPSPLERARRLTAGADLLPVARMQTNRTILMAVRPDGTSVELAVDRCLATRISDHRFVEFVEIEAELKVGEPDVLSDALDGLRSEVPGLRPSLKTKLERALE